MYLFLEAEESKMKGLADLVSSEGLLPSSQMALFSLWPHVVEGVREPSGVSFVRTLISVIRAQPSGPKHLPDTPPLNTITLGVRISTYEFGKGNTSMQSTAAETWPEMVSSNQNICLLNLYLSSVSCKIYILFHDIFF